MATQVRPDDPNATDAARAQAMVGGPRDPGTPSMAGKPGVQAGRTSFPTPPAPAANGLPGRPAQPAPAPMGARGAMTQPGTPAAGAVPQPAATQPTAATPPQPPGSPAASAAGSSVTQGTGAPAAPAPPSLDANGGMATQTFTSPTIPPAGTLAPGSAVQTPHGTVSPGPSGEQRLALDANGTQRYKETMAALRSRFVTPRVMRGMAGLPEMELKLGVSNFDPFGGRFHGKE